MLIFLAIIQGITEFLPVSSSAHLIIVAKLFGNYHPGMTLIVALHIGSLFAVLLYFKEDFLKMIFGLLNFIQGKGFDPHFKLGLLICLSTLPIVMGGIFLPRIINTPESTALVIGFNSIFFGIGLLLSDQRLINPNFTILNMPIPHAVFIGMIQICAILPGASRSGSAIMAARLLGYSRIDATKFAFLLGIPTIIGAAVLECSKISLVDLQNHAEDLALGCLVSFLASYCVISSIMKLLLNVSFLPFALYRVTLGILLIYFL
jgi:undecaprenyl-diphosphatase